MRIENAKYWLSFVGLKYMRSLCVHTICAERSTGRNLRVQSRDTIYDGYSRVGVLPQTPRYSYLYIGYYDRYNNLSHSETYGLTVRPKYTCARVHQDIPRPSAERMYRKGIFDGYGHLIVNPMGSRFVPKHDYMPLPCVTVA